MEVTIYLDSSMENVQKVRTRDHDVRVKPRELAAACYPNYYAVSIDGGHLMKNPDRQVSSNSMLHNEPKVESDISSRDL